MLETPCTNFVTLYSGTRVTRTSGAPTLEDIAVTHGRLCRWAGNLTEFWSTLLHEFVVADLTPWHLKCHALLHDATDTVTNDTPKPMKSDEQSVIEHAVMDRTFESLGLPALSKAEYRKIKVADNLSRNAEAWCFGNEGHKSSYPERDLEVEKLVMKYFKKYPARDCLKANGQAAQEFLRRYGIYKQMLAR